MTDAFSNDPITPSLIRLIDLTCDRFERAWLSGERPKIEEYLHSSGHKGDARLFQQLLWLEIDYRKQAGEQPAEREYCDRFPDFTASITSAFQHLDGGPSQETADWTTGSTGNNDDSQSPPRTLTGIEGEFGRFQVFESLGRGAFGSVYRAWDTRLERNVALKVPRAGILTDQEDVDRFMREARAASMLRHPNIVPIYETGEVDGVYYIASGLISGHTLRQAIKQHEYSTPRQAASLIAKLAAALHYAHNKGIIHRDNKPENIVIDDAGEPHIMDFGLARREQGDVVQTIKGAQMGTPAYMSPEQARGESHLADARSDLWSLGVVLYELLAGERPFQGNSAEILARIVQREPQSLRSINSAVPRDLETICLKSLAKDPGQRYASCQQLADDLVRWLEGRPIEARSVAFTERAWRACRRNPVIATLAATSAVLLVSGSVLSTYFALEANQRANDAKHNETLKGIAQAGQKRAEKTVQHETEHRVRTEQKAELEEYVKVLTQIQVELNEGNTQRARELLASCPNHLRGWEWYHLRSRFTENSSTMQASFTSADLVVPNASGNRLLVTTSNVSRIEGSGKGQSILLGGHEPVTAAAFTSDGHWVATAHPGNAESTVGRETPSVKVWPTTTNGGWLPPVGWMADELDEFTEIRCLAFSPDATLLAIGGSRGYAGRLELREVDTHVLVSSVPAHMFGINDLCFSPDGAAIATAGMDGTVDVLDLRAGQIDGRLALSLDSSEKLTTSSLSIGPGGVRVVAQAMTDEGRERQLVTSERKKPVWTVAFNHDGTKVAAGGNNGSLRIWSAKTGDLIHTLEGHVGNVRTIEFSEDGGQLASGGDDGKVKLWSAKDGELIYSFAAHTEGVRCVFFKPESNEIGSAGQDGQIKFWRNRPSSFEGHRNPVVALACSQSNEQLISHSTGHHLAWWSVADSKVENSVVYEPHRFFEVSDADFCEALGVFVVITGERAVQLRDMATGDVTLTLTGHQERVHCAAFSPNAAYLLTADERGAIHLWEADTGNLIRVFAARAAVLALAWSPDSTSFVAGSDDHSISVWSVSGENAIKSFSGHTATIRDVTFGPYGRLVASAGDDKTVRVWNIESGKVVVLRGHPDSVRAVTFDIDGQRIISAGASTKIWDASTGTELLTLRGHSGPVNAIALSSDGKFIATASENATIRVWNSDLVAIAAFESDEGIRKLLSSVSFADLDLSADPTRDLASLSHIGADSLKQLTRALESESARHRAAAVTLLSYMEDRREQVLPAIQQVLGDDHPLVRKKAKWALEKLGTEVRK